MRTQLGRVRGLGSAKTGVHHWWLQRATAFANLVLMAWLIVGLAALPALDYANVRAWLSSLWGAVPMALLVFSLLWHARLGLQVPVEDYLHGPRRMAAIAVITAFVFILGGIAFFALVRLVLLGGAL